jgi:hypothetical protein
MHFRPFFPAALFAAGLLLAACDSSSPAAPGPIDPSGGKDNPSGENDEYAPNGTLAIAGKTLPVLVSAVFEDTDMFVTASSHVTGSPDTNWLVSVSAKSGKATTTLPLETNYQDDNSVLNMINGFYSACIYSITAGSLHIDSWSETAFSAGKLAKMSGGSVMTLSLDPSSSAPSCPERSATLTFTNASAAQLGP